MTIFSSLPKSPDVLSFLAGLEGGKSPKSVPSEGRTGSPNCSTSFPQSFPPTPKRWGF